MNLGGLMSWGAKTSTDILGTTTLLSQLPTETIDAVKVVQNVSEDWKAPVLAAVSSLLIQALFKIGKKGLSLLDKVLTKKSKPQVEEPKTN